jgi:hypothetical protein
MTGSQRHGKGRCRLGARLYPLCRLPLQMLLLWLALLAAAATAWERSLQKSNAAVTSATTSSTVDSDDPVVVRLVEQKLPERSERVDRILNVFLPRPPQKPKLRTRHKPYWGKCL